MLGTDPVLPLAIAEFELLGLLGPDPGALLQRDDTGPGTHNKTKDINLTVTRGSLIMKTLFYSVFQALG